jgi:hypothetical protein
MEVPASVLLPLLAVTLTASSAYAEAKDGLSAFLDSHCISCHDPEKKKGKLDLTPAVADSGSIDAETLISMLDLLSAGEMPPEDEPQPSAAELKTAADTLQTLVQVSASAPGRGNLIDHKTLFTEPKIRKASTPARIWRLSPHIFKSYANELTLSRFLNQDGGREGGDGMHPAFAYMTPTHAFSDHAGIHMFEDATSELLFDVCWMVAGEQIGKNRKGMKPPSFMAVLKGGSPTKKQWVDLIQTQFELCLRREATEDEVEHLVELAEKTKQDTNIPMAVQTVLATVLLRPDAVYRYEVGRGDPDKYGRVRLGDFELAYAISYALSDGSPDETMLAAVKNGGLSDKAGVLAQIKRLREDPKSEERIIRFFREYFEYPRMVEVFKDLRHPNYILAESRIEDTDRLIAWILKEDKEVLRRLLTEDKVFAIADGGNGTAFFNNMVRKYYLPDYGIPVGWDWKGEQPVKPTTGRRSGILTHPAWLLTFSDNEKNQAIQRGRWVYMKLLGGSIPDTPIGVDAVLPEDPDKTLRERMHVTTEKYCWRCHQRMDPMGLTFEQFDDFGRWRDEEKGRPIEAKGNIDIGDPALDGPVKDAFEMLQRMSKSERVEQVFTRYVFRYFLGRNETIDDAPTLIDAHRAYREAGGSFKALVESLLTSDSYLLRKR